MELRTLASTKSTFHKPTYQSILDEDAVHEAFVKQNESSDYTYPQLHHPKNNNNPNFNIISHLQWMDSSTVLTKSTDNAFRLYITSSDLLEGADEQLIPFIRTFHNTTIQSFETHPLSSVYNGSIPTLISSKEMPLKLVDLVPDEEGKYRLLKTFDNVNKFNEIYESFQTLKFLNDEVFIAGGAKMIKLYDVNRNEPISEVKGIKGVVSSVTLSHSEFTYNGFYSGGFNGHLSIHDSQGDIVENIKLDSKDGNGISQILESNNGRCLYVISRNANHIKVVDLRMGLKELENYDLELSDFTHPNQRIFGDVLKNGHGLMIGSTDGELHWFKDSELGQSTNHIIGRVQNAGHGTISNVKINPDESNVIACGFGDRENTDCGLVVSCVSEAMDVDV